ncbi:MAG TPA: hypothetical protein VMT85_05795 [Thermoanaerobaculia bacterium]|nr:hypothetical protein [Thermoanaerobaculia bacterium]
MSCPDWRLLREGAGSGEAAGDVRAEVRRHLEECEECRRAAVAYDPSLLFTVFSPSVEVSAATLERMRERVAGARAMRQVEPGLRRRWVRLGSRAAAAVLLPLAGLGLVVAAAQRLERPATSAEREVAIERETPSHLDPLLAEALARLPLIEGAAPVTVQEEGIGYDLVMVVDAGLEL